MISRRLPALLLALWLTATPVLAADASFDLSEDKPAKGADRTCVVSSEKELAELGIPEHGFQSVAIALRNALKDAPPGTKVRLVIGEQTEGSVRWRQAYAKSAVPLDAEGRPQGVEYLVVGVSLGTAEPLICRYIPWQHGVRHGVEKEYHRTTLSAEVPWENGKMAGVRKSYYPNGKLQSETNYVDGLASGPVRTWNQQGELIKEGTLKAGVRDGTFTEYWPGSTQPQRVVNYRNGLANGVVREYYLSGKLRRERTLNDEVLHGLDTSYTEKGEVTETRYWFKGESVTQAEFAQRSKQK